MEKRKDSRASDREKRHRFGEAIDRSSPVLMQEIENGRDESARMTDPDPPNEVDDRESPGHRDVDAPDPHASDEEPGYGDEEKIEQREREHQTREPPPPRAPVIERETADLVTHFGEGAHLSSPRVVLAR